MAGADILVGAVDANGGVSIGDYWSKENGTPQLDECQDWVLVAGSSADGVTAIEAVRPLDTGDRQDRPLLSVKGQPTRVIAAMGESGDLSYHGSTRLATRIRMYSPGDADPLAHLRAQETTGQVASIELRQQNYAIPSDTTTYTYDCYDVSDMPTSHAIAFEHVISSETAQFVHHVSSITPARMQLKTAITGYIV